MARRSSPSRGSSGFGRGRSPSPTSRRSAPPPKAVAPTPTPAPTQVAQPTMAAPGGGMMANIASTAAGVAIGHTVGHAITSGLGIGGGHHSEPVVAESQDQSQPQQLNQQPLAGQDACKFEMEQFMACAQNQNDLSLCEGFNQVLRECKARYGDRPMY